MKLITGVILSGIFILQIFIIISLSQKIFSQKIIINSLDKNHIVTVPRPQYKYFYEINANKTLTTRLQWDNNPLTYYHNSGAMNNKRDYPLYRKPNTIRIAAIGDSFTYGLNVSTVDNWVSGLEQKLNLQACNKRSFEILNFGVPGYDIEYALERNVIRVERYKPDLYVWFIKDDDFSEPKELTIPIQSKLENGSKYSLNNYINALKQVYEKRGKDNIIQSEIEHLEKYIKKNPNINILFVVPSGKLGYPSINNRNLDFLRKLKSKYANILLYSIEMTDSDTFFPDDYHLNANGNKLFVEKLFPLIRGKFCI